MLKVGINSNVLLTGATINDKGSLVVSFKDKSVQAPISAEDDLLNSTAGVKASSGETNIIIWPVQVESNGQPREAKDIANDLRAVRDQLEHLLLGYVTSDRAALKPYEGLDTTNGADFAASLSKQPVIDKIYKNLTTQFIAKIAEIKDLREVQTFRLLLLRRSVANHYGAFRKNFITDNPFWESEQIPAEASKVKFTTWELNKKLNDGTPVAKATVADALPTGAVSAANDILGIR